MAHVSNVDSGIFSEIRYSDTAGTALPTTPTIAKTVLNEQISTVLEMPDFTEAPNLIGYGVFGEETERQARGFNTSPELTFTVGLTGEAFNKYKALQDGKTYLFGLVIKNSETANADNSILCWQGKFITVSPTITGDGPATFALTLSKTSKFTNLLTYAS